MGQILQQVKASMDNPDNVFLANRIDGSLIAPDDIRKILRLVEGKGV
jgi:2-oxoglutarate ferredoxin oxidoreductase subunit alpha